jgi:GT2 family glycosyltransferase
MSVAEAQGESGTGTRVSIIIVTHNNIDVIGRCLRAVFTAPASHPIEVLVVDNASTDGTAEELADSDWPVVAIPLKENVGFARAVNRAWAQATGSYVGLVNSDAFLDPGCIDRLADGLDRNSRAGIVGAKLRYPSGRLQPSAGTFPTVASGLWVALGLHRAPGLSLLGVGFIANERLYRDPRRVDWVSAAVCAGRRELGPLPENSFMYGEDVEWAAACRARGFGVWLDPRATAVHIGRHSVGESHEVGFAQQQRAEFELRWFARRSPLVRFADRLTMLLHAALRVLLFTGSGLIRGKADRRVAEYAALFRAAANLQTPR